MLVLLAAFSLNTRAEGQGTTKAKGHMIPGESVSPQLSGKVLYVLFDGVADLYQETEGAANYYYISDINGRLFTLSVPQKEGKVTNLAGRQGVISVLKIMMHDAPALHDRIESCEVTGHELVALMHDYHVSITGSEEGIDYELPPPALIPHIGFFAGYNIDMLEVSSTNDLSNIELDPAFFPTAGISFIAFLPRISNNLSVNLDLSVGKRYVYGFYSSTAVPPPLLKEFQELHLHNYLLLSDLQVVYKHGNGLIRPFASGGICARTIISDNSRIETDVLWITEVLSDSFSCNLKEKTSLGLKAALGITFATPGKVTLTTSLNYSEYFISSAYKSCRSVGLALGANF